MAPSLTADLIGVRPEFTVPADCDVDAVKAYLLKFVARVAEGMENGKAVGCLHYDFVWNSDNTKFQCREFYATTKDLCDHVAYTGDLYPGLWATGAQLSNTEVTCTKKHTEDDEFMKQCKGFNATLYYMQ